MQSVRDRELLGSWGESVAAAYLKKRRYTVTAANYRCRGGELDLIAEKGGFIVFVEVKLRKNADHGEAREFVTREKQRRVIYAAQHWLISHPTKLQPRFDVIEIYAPAGIKTEKPEINHIEDAFET